MAARCGAEQAGDPLSKSTGRRLAIGTDVIFSSGLRYVRSLDALTGCHRSKDGGCEQRPPAVDTLQHMHAAVLQGDIRTPLCQPPVRQIRLLNH